MAGVPYPNHLGEPEPGQCGRSKNKKRMKGTGTDGYRLVQSFRWSVASAIHFIGRRRNADKMGGRIERTKTSQKTVSKKGRQNVIATNICRGRL